MDSDAKGKPKDEVEVLAGEETVQPEKAPDSEETSLEDSSTKAPKVYTEDEVEKKFSQQRSVLDKKIAEMEKALNKFADAKGLAEKRASEAESSLQEMQRQKDDAELAGVRDNPDALGLFQARQRVRQRDAVLAKREQDVMAKESEIAEARREVEENKKSKLASAIASKYEGVEADLLLELTDGSPEKMEALAKRLHKPKARTSKSPDSGETIGGTGKPTMEQLENMPMEEFAKHASKSYK